MFTSNITKKGIKKISPKYFSSKKVKIQYRQGIIAHTNDNINAESKNLCSCFNKV